MDRIRRSIRQSFRRSKKVPSSASSGDTSQPAQWQNDEAAVRAGNCSFQVKYLGCIEVFESRGMQICEEALKQLRQSNRKTQRAVLHISGDGLRVDDATSSQLIVDQTIEKVSFCAPDRNHDRGFSYICRDGATRRWLCHGFIAVRESKATLQGERLSHAVGCAFQICLEKKQKRDRETAQPASTPAPSSQTESASIHHYPSSTVHATPPRSASSLPFTNHSAPSSASPFTRQSSARMSSIADRMKDPQEYKAASPPPPPIKTVVNPHMRDRPHVTPQMLQRQQSLRTLSTLNSATPFKRNMSLESRADPAEVVRSAKWRQMSVDVPSVMQQNQQQLMPVYRGLVNSNVPTWEDGSAIMDPDALPEESEELTDEVSRLCQQMSFDLSMMSASANHVVNGFPHSSASATAHSNGPAPGSGPYALPKSMSSPFPPDKRPPPGSAREARAKFAERSPFSRTVHPPLPAVNGHRLFSSMRDTDRQGTAVNPTIDWSDKDPFNTDNVNWVNLSKTSTNPFVV